MVFMDKKNLKLGRIAIHFLMILFFICCEQFSGPGNDGSRDSTFDKDYLLIEVWDISSPAKFLGYDTGLRSSYNNNIPIILTSTGYCVELRSFTSFGIGSKRNYGSGSSVPFDPASETDNNREYDWGAQIVYKTVSNPTENDIPYLMGGTINLTNFVYYTAYNGGTYYTYLNDRSESVKFPANFKLIDIDGTLKTCNDSLLGNMYRGENYQELVGETLQLRPLKKIGGYAELGLPNPETVTRGIIFKGK